LNIKVLQGSVADAFKVWWDL